MGFSAGGAGKVNLSGQLSASASGTGTASGSFSASASGSASVNVSGSVSVGGSASFSGSGQVSAGGALAAAGAASAALSGGAASGELSGGAAAAAASLGAAGSGGGKSLRIDPATALLFRVEIDGIAVADFLECSGLKDTTEVIDYYEGGENSFTHKFIGNTKYTNIILKRGITAGSKTIWDWRGTFAQDKKPKFKDGSIILLNDSEKEICRWNFREGWPCRWEGPNLKGDGDAVAVETLEIAHHGYSVTLAS